MKKLLLTLIGLSFYVASAQWMWSPRASLPSDGRESSGAFTIGDNLYVICGRTSYTPYVEVSEVWQYNAPTDKWTQKADFPGGARTAPLAFAVDGKGYVVSGGYPAMYNDCWQYDPATDTWTQKKDFPGAGRYTSAHFVLGKMVYMVGGYYNGTQTNEVWVYNTTLDHWDQLKTFAGGKVQGATGFEISGTGYIVAGVTGHSNYVALKSAWKYDEVYDIWVKIADYPGAARVAPVSFELNGLGYVGLGASALFNTHYTDFYAYHPVTDLWAPAPSLPDTGRRHGVAGRIGNKAFVGTGVNGPWDAPSTFFSDLYSFGESVGLSEEAASQKELNLTFNMVSDHLEVNMPSAGEIFIHNSAGHVVWQGTLAAGATTIPAHDLAEGFYMVSSGDFPGRVKFIVMR